LLQFDPEGFGEIPLEDFVAALRSPEWRAEIPTNKRDILLSRAKESRVQAVTFQDFVNVVSPDALHVCIFAFIIMRYTA
jgi:rhomboid-related protein 1/2/3